MGSLAWAVRDSLGWLDGLVSGGGVGVTAMSATAGSEVCANNINKAIAAMPARLGLGRWYFNKALAEQDKAAGYHTSVGRLLQRCLGSPGEGLYPCL